MSMDLIALQLPIFLLSIHIITTFGRLSDRNKKQIHRLECMLASLKNMEKINER